MKFFTLILTIIYAILTFSCASGKNYVKEGVDKVIKTEHGNVTFEDTEFKHIGNKNILLKGFIVNNTNKVLYSAKFKFSLLDDFERKTNNNEFIIETGNNLNLKEKSYIKFTEVFKNIENNSKIEKFSFELVDLDYYANYKFSMLKPIKNDNLFFEDKLIKINFDIKSDGISLNLKNKTEDPIEIDWNKISYVNEKSKSDKIFHAGVRYIEKEKSMPETVIAPLAEFSDILVPVSLSRYSDYLKQWITDAILPINYSSGINNLNKTISVFIPLKIGSDTKNYFFNFKIDKVEKL